MRGVVPIVAGFVRPAEDDFVGGARLGGFDEAGEAGDGDRVGDEPFAAGLVAPPLLVAVCDGGVAREAVEEVVVVAFELENGYLSSDFRFW